MGRIRTIYLFKVRQFFGPLRKELGAVIVLAILAIFLLPPIFFFGYFVPTLPIWQSPNLGEVFAAALSTFLVFDLVFALGGGTLTHPVEIDFFATSRLRPREYLVADYLFQFTITNGLAVPALVLAGLGLGFRLGNWAQVFGGIISFVSFAAIGLALGQAVGLGIAARRRGARAILVALILILLVPGLHFAWSAAPGYGSIPLPSSAAAALILGLLFGGPVLPGAAVLIVLAVAIGAAWLWMSAEDVFPHLRPTMRIAFGQMSFQSRVAQQEAIIRGLSRLTRRVPLDLTRGSTLGMMTRLHLTRILRDGSIFVVALITGILGFIGAVSRVDAEPQSELVALSTGWVAVMIPVILAFNWNVMERASLWTVATAPRYIATYFRGMYRGFLLITFAGAVVSTIAGGFVTVLGALAPILMSLAACGVAVVVFAAVKIPADAFSLKAVLPFLVVPIAALGAGAPVIGFAILAGSSELWAILAWPVTIVYFVGIFALFDRLAVSASHRFQM